MGIDGTRRVMETNSYETANQYLRFGWSLINQHVVEAMPDQPATVKYVLASVRRLEDTRSVVVVNDSAQVNEYLDLGWRLIDKFVTVADPPERRDETLHFVLAWQSDDLPARPGVAPLVKRGFDLTESPGEALAADELAADELVAEDLPVDDQP